LPEIKQGFPTLNNEEKKEEKEETKEDTPHVVVTYAINGKEVTEEEFWEIYGESRDN
jgi:hypothetical protein